jgi:hypothetical protein
VALRAAPFSASSRKLEAGMTDQKPSEWRIFLGPTRQRMSNELVRKAFEPP